MTETAQNILAFLGGIALIVLASGIGAYVSDRGARRSKSNRAPKEQPHD